LVYPSSTGDTIFRDYVSGVSLVYKLSSFVAIFYKDYVCGVSLVLSTGEPASSYYSTTFGILEA